MPNLLNLTKSDASIRPSTSIIDRYQCREDLPGYRVAGTLNGDKGFFRLGSDLICYGRSAIERVSPDVTGTLFDASRHVRYEGDTIVLPFDMNEALDNLRCERYVTSSRRPGWIQQSWVRNVYYQLRPMLLVSVRKHLQRIYFRDWNKIPFPSWPLDRSADLLLERLLVVAMQTLGARRLPFIWFWPNDHKACAIVTHDVETKVGRDFTSRLMDLDDSFGIKSSFQIVPEKRYSVPPAYLKSIRDRGFELNIHGLDHEGDLFQTRKAFLETAKKINQYAKLFGSRGFRSPTMYRNADWFRELDFSYDMSVPNVARLEAQRGGCCTVMPYFLPGNILELPLTTTADYSLFHILNDYSTTVWRQQISLILQGHGLMSFIIHPDYVVSNRAQDVYKALLEQLSALPSDHGVWLALPGEVDVWWRQRSRMQLVPNGKHWTIEGTGSERARVAYACLDGDKLTYEIN